MRGKAVVPSGGVVFSELAKGCLMRQIELHLGVARTSHSFEGARIDDGTAADVK